MPAMPIKLKFPVLISVLLSMFLTIPPAGAEDPTNIALPGTPYRIKLPAGFEKSTKVSGASILAFYQPADAKGLYPGFTATLEDHGGKSLDAVCDHLLGLLPGAVLNSRESITMGGMEALIADISSTSFLGEVRAVRLLANHEGKVLALSFADRDASFTSEALTVYLAALKTLDAG
jgi:hypothetical protein